MKVDIHVLPIVLLLLGLALTALVPFSLFGLGPFLIGMAYVSYLHGRVKILESKEKT